MLAPDYREQMTVTNTRGQGYLLLDGKGLYHIQVPTVTNTGLLTHTLQHHLGLYTNTTADDAGEA